MAPRTRKPPPDHAILELDRFLPYRLSVLSNRISQDIARLYVERFGLGITEWRVLAVLGRHDDAGRAGVHAEAPRHRAFQLKAYLGHMLQANRAVGEGNLDRAEAAVLARRIALRLNPTASRCFFSKFIRIYN